MTTTQQTHHQYSFAGVTPIYNTQSNCDGVSPVRESHIGESYGLNRTFKVHQGGQYKVEIVYCDLNGNEIGAGILQHGHDVSEMEYTWSDPISYAPAISAQFEQLPNGKQKTTFFFDADGDTEYTIYIYDINDPANREFTIHSLKATLVPPPTGDPITNTYNPYRYRFNGKEWVTQGLPSRYDYGARMYDAAVGRWMSVDPLADHPYQIGMSPYSAFWNNPIRWNDPDGRCPECEENVTDPTDGQSYTSTAGSQYTFEKGEWTREGGTMQDVTITASSVNEKNTTSNLNSTSSAASDLSTGLSLTGAGIWLKGENKSTGLYQKGIRKGINSNYQLKGRNLSLFKNSPISSASKPITGWTNYGNLFGHLGTGLSVLSLGIDARSYYYGQISATRFGYHVIGVSTSVATGYTYGGPHGALVGGLFFLTEKAWDVTMPVINEVNDKFWEFNNAIKTGWKPRR